MNIGIVISPTTELPNCPLRKQLPEPYFYEQLTVYGKQQQQFVYVFKSCDFNKRKRLIMGYRYEDGQWQQKQLPLPDIIIDRTFHQNQLQARKHSLYMNQLSQSHSYLMLNTQLPNKLIIYEQLKQTLPHIIPPSQYYNSIHTLEELLDHYKTGVILKPLSGMHGKGIIHITKQEKQYVIQGRQLNNHPISINISSRMALQKWLLYFRQNINYLIQPYYEFRTNQDEPFDIRVLMQKNENGQWQNSGHIARVGQKEHLTSNLHGGGKSVLSVNVLDSLFNANHVSQLLSSIHTLSEKIVNQLEENFGRFGEIALDFGITKQGNIVLLECNSKPGRQAFMQLASHSDAVILNPLRYANYLFQHYINPQAKSFHHLQFTSNLH